jgi:hypothetical protein
LLPYTNLAGTGLIPAGLLLFGVGTESNNALGSASIYALDSEGNFKVTVTVQGAQSFMNGFIDSASNALYVLDAQTLGTQVCADNPYYCPSSTIVFSGQFPWSIANADTLFGNNPSFAAFNNLGGPSGTSLSTDYFDYGLPFFFGRPIFVGIAGTTVPNNASAPNGYYAY